VRRSASDEWARFGAAPGAGVELLHAHYRRHVYARHSHETYAIGVTEAGAQAFTCRGAAHLSSAGRIMTFNPDEPHDGRAGDAAGFTYRMLYVAPATMARALEDAFERPVALPFFTYPVVDDPALAAQLRRLHAAFAQPGPALAQGELLARSLVALATRAADGGLRAPPAARSRPALRRARDFLHAHLSEDVAIETLAEIAGISRFHLIRLFEREFGLPPHAYLLRLRLEAAKRLLAASEAPAAIAAATGFVDQSHLSRRFKRSYGITPGQYARAMAGG
jgi:AraC-like DNA-binding protein